MTSTSDIVLKEYESKSVALSSAEALVLAKIRVSDRSLDGTGDRRRRVVSIEPDGPGTYRVTANSIVGSLTVAGRQITLLPKIGGARTLFLASHDPDRIHWQDVDGQFDPSATFHDLLAAQFLRRTEQVLAGGLLEGYHDVEEALQFLRGRILFANQLSRRAGLPLPVEVRYSEFGPNVIENQIIKAALVRIMEFNARSRRSVRRARRALPAFDNIELIDGHQLLGDVQITERNRHYRAAIELAQLILRGQTIEVAVGGVRARGLLFDMSQIFEDFVAHYMVESAGDGLRFRQGSKGRRIYLDEDQRVRLKPDLTFWRRRDCVALGDVKYKDIDQRGVSNSDVYQLVSYALALGLDQATLVHPGTAEAPSIKIAQASIQILVEHVDVSQQPTEIIRRLREIRSSIVGASEPAAAGAA